MPFVYVIDPDEADQLQSKRAEDPAYALDHGLELDLLYYVQQQLISPLATLLSLYSHTHTHTHTHTRTAPV